MATISCWKVFHLLYLSRPKHDRVLYRVIRKGGIQRILELGLGTARRAERMLALATAQAEGGATAVRYAGIDLFDTRGEGDGPPMSLKDTYRRLRSSGAKIQLLPGDPFSALSRAASSLGPLDLIVISAEVAGPSLSRAWFYLPRLLHSGTIVYYESLESGKLKPLSARQITRLATSSVLSRKAA